jgi:hypothetical protein
MWHRQAAALVAAADRVGVAEAELPMVQLRLLDQRARFAEVVAGTDTPIPELVPTPAEIAAAMPALGDLSATAVAAALGAMAGILDAADAALESPQLLTEWRVQSTWPATAELVTRPAPPSLPVPQPPPAATFPKSAVPAPDRSVPARPRRAIGTWPAAGRNALVYGGYTFAMSVVIGFLFFVVDEQTLPLLAPTCLLIMPAFAWAAGWLTVGLAFRAGPGEKRVNRTPRVGALICLIPDLLICAAVPLLFAFQRITA